MVAQIEVPPVGGVDLGDLRRPNGITENWGMSRGQPVDRYYIEQFLQQHAGDIKGHVLEIQNDQYTKQFGGRTVVQSHVLDIVPDNPRATVVGDLSNAPHLPDSYYDCIILTQTLQYVINVPAAIATLTRILNPGGVLLLTVPGISPIEGKTALMRKRWGSVLDRDPCYNPNLSLRRQFHLAFPPRHQTPGEMNGH
jgi:SAM-dependent methyltransferase